MRLTGYLLNEVQDIIMPHCLKVNEREAILTMALWETNSIYDVQLEGSTRVFTLRLVATLSRDNLISVLKEISKNYVGLEGQQRIEKACIELEKLPPDDTALIDLVKLRSALSQLFTKAELAELCFDIQDRLKKNGLRVILDLEQIGADGSVNMISQNLMSFLQRRDLLSLLVEAVKEARPHADLYDTGDRRW